MFTRKFFCCVAAVTMALSACSCTNETPYKDKLTMAEPIVIDSVRETRDPGQEIVPVETTAEPKEHFTVRLEDNDGVEEIDVESGEELDLRDGRPMRGYTFYAWSNVRKRMVCKRSTSITVNENMTMRAIYLPALAARDEAPFLAYDPAGFLNSDGYVTHEEAVMFLAKCIMPDAYVDETDEESTVDFESYDDVYAVLEKILCIREDGLKPEDTLTMPQLAAMFEPFFYKDWETYELTNVAEDNVYYSAVCFGISRGWITMLEDGSVDMNEPVTRLRFAQVTNDVFNRTGDESALESARGVFFDVPEDDNVAMELVTAMIPHTYSDDSDSAGWENIEMPERPFENFTMGNLEVDAWLKSIIDEQITEDMSTEDKLRALYRYVRDTTKYRKGTLYWDADYDFTLDEVTKRMTVGAGNCFTYSSTLCSLYRAIGIDARLYGGRVGNEQSPHGWCEATIDGVEYIFDVELEATNALCKNPYVDFFMQTHDQLKGWAYIRNFVLEWDD